LYIGCFFSRIWARKQKIRLEKGKAERQEQLRQEGEWQRKSRLYRERTAAKKYAKDWNAKREAVQDEIAKREKREEVFAAEENKQKKEKINFQKTLEDFVETANESDAAFKDCTRGPSLKKKKTP